MSIQELDALRETQIANKLKPKYDGTWRPEIGKTLPPIPAGVQPVLRFKNPKDGFVSWHDKVKGLIEISNEELDDLVIARPDGTPTYNFCVVVDDIDMAITHVIRGDDHVNNTPRQINIFKALGHAHPTYAHLPTVLNEQGEKMSKRNGAKAVTAYEAEGYLPQAMINYLARLGWSHGDDEIFSVEQFLSWFDLDHLGKSAAQFDEAKLKWVNAQHIKALPQEELAERVKPYLIAMDVVPDARLPAICQLLKDRCDTLVALAKWVAVFYSPVQPNPEELVKHVTDLARPAILMLKEQLEVAHAWDAPTIAQIIKDVLTQTGLKMPQLAMPVRVLLAGTSQTPSLDAVISLFHQKDVVERLSKA
jgi:glutamyl-tRNA synthetase